MSSEIKYKEKYDNLKSKFMESVDLAFRLGFEQGQQKSAQDQMAQQQQQAEMQAAQQAQVGQGQPDDGSGQEPSAPEADPSAPTQNPMGSELDQHIGELEGMLGKAEISQDDLKKTIGAIKQLRELKKSHEAIKGIGLALHTNKYKMSKMAQHNLTDTAKASLHIQKKIVDDIFKSWDEEEKGATKEIGSVLAVEGLIK